LDQLSGDDFNRLAPHFQPVSLVQRANLFRIGDALAEVFFPVKGMLSLLVSLEDGREVEAAVIGNEGAAGAPALLGIEVAPYRVIAQAATEGLSMPRPAFLRALERIPRFDALLRRYLAVALHNAQQLIACNALHSANARLCRWLLMAHDRLGPNCCPLTHEFLAEMLGVRRQTVTAATRALQQMDLITNQRGSLTINDRAGLESAACECYRVIQAYQEQFLG
jgi:CRP-like cAMP-binding protein